MEDSIWELRFLDGRGASFFTSVDLTDDLGKAGVTRTIPVAASVYDDTALADARRCLERGEVIRLVANMAAVAYLVRREPPA